MSNDTQVATRREPSANTLEHTSAERTRERVVFQPPSDIYESENEYVLVADVPGASKDTLDIDLENNVLTIHASVRDHTPDGYTPAYREYTVGDFERSFRLSDEIDRDSIRARFDQGVLTLTLPKAQPTRKRIVVQAT